MATRSITYCDRCKNDVSAFSQRSERLAYTGYSYSLLANVAGAETPKAFDLCGVCLRDFEKDFMRVFEPPGTFRIPPPVPPL